MIRQVTFGFLISMMSSCKPKQSRAEKSRCHLLTCIQSATHL